jgi:predicted nucleotide-binding protein
MMPLFQEYNQTQEQALEHLRKFLEVNEKLYGPVRVRSVSLPSRQNTDEWQCGFCYIKVYPKGTEKLVSESIRYREIHLLEEWIEPSKVVSILSGAAEGSIEVDGELSVIEKSFVLNQREFHGSPNPYSDFPGWLYQGNRSTSITFPYEQLVQPPLPHFSSGESAVASWMDFKPFHGNSDGRRGSILIFLPECRARFSKIIFDRRKFELDIHREANAGRKLFVTGSWFNNRNSIENISVEVKDQKISLPVNKEANSFQVFLADHDGTIYDYRQSSEVDPKHLAKDVSEELLSGIMGNPFGQVPSLPTKKKNSRARWEEQSKRLLKMLYDQAKDDLGLVFMLDDGIDELGISENDIEPVIQILSDREFVNVTPGGGVKLTIGGIEEVESTDSASGEDKVQIKNIDETPTQDRSKVFIIHGRNIHLKTQLDLFLRSIELHPMDWNEAVALTGEANPYIGDVLDKVFAEANALLVLMTPDDETRLKQEFWRKSESAHEKNLVGQCRPNVIFETGMALGLYRNNTVLVEIGNPKQFTDNSGRHVLRLDDTIEKRNDLIQKLRQVGCDAKTRTVAWITTGSFAYSSRTKARKTRRNQTPRRRRK